MPFISRTALIATLFLFYCFKPDMAHSLLLHGLRRSLPVCLSESLLSSKPEPSNLKVAVVGGGLAGLSTAWHLTGLVKQVSIFDPRPPGQAEASAVAGGLLHPLTPKNRLLWCGLRGFEATSRLVVSSKTALSNYGDTAGASRLQSAPGAILRPALTSQHVIDFQAAAKRLPNWLKWLNGEEWEQKVGVPGHGLLLRQSAILSMPDYLRGLWLSSQARAERSYTALTWESSLFTADCVKQSGAKYDVVVLASGAGIRAFPELEHLPVEFVRGRTLLVADESKGGVEPSEQESAQSLQCALLCGEYVVPGVDTEMCSDAEGKERRVLRCGSTREYLRDSWHVQDGIGVGKMGGRRTEEWFQSEKNDGEIASLRRKAESIYPPLRQGPEAYRVTSGTRVATRRSNLGKLPIVGRLEQTKGAEGIKAETWLFTGLGGRGVVHHGFLGECLAQAILTGDETHLPSEVRAPLQRL